MNTHKHLKNLPSVTEVRKAFERTIFWNYMISWPGDDRKDEPYDLSVYEQPRPDADPLDPDRVDLRFECGECSITVATMYPIKPGRDAESGVTREEVAFVASLPRVLPALFAEIDRLNAELGKLRDSKPTITL